MANAPDLRHLWNRGSRDRRQNWYLKLPIPKPLRKHFPRTKGGNEQIAVIEPLDTGDLAVARRKRDELVVRYRRVFDRLSAGEEMTPDQIKTAVSLDLEVVAEQYKAKTLQLLPIWFRRLAQKYSPDQMELPPHLHVEPFLFSLEFEVEEIVKSLGIPIPLNSELYKMVRAELMRGRQAAYDAAQEKLAEIGEPAKATPPAIERLPATATATEPAESISQAAAAWFEDMQRDPSAAVRQQTLDGHKLYVRAAVEHFGDVPLASITRAQAADFLSKIGTSRSNRTTNKYATTLAGVFKSARSRGRFLGANPFEGLKRKAGGQKYAPLTMPELQSLFGSFTFELAPKQHTPESALPWAALIGLYSGLRLEEIAQLDVADVHPQDGIMVFEIHNGSSNHLKNGTSERLVPVHSELIRFGLLDYRDALPKDGILFPGLSRRASKGGKIGPRLGELFRKRLERLEIKQKAERDNRRVCFHSLRKNAGGAMERGGASESDAGRVLGHALGMTFGTYSQPVLKRVQETIERIRYEGLKLPASKLSAKR
jgi:integrase